MKRVAIICSWLALAATIVPALLFMTGNAQLETVKATMLWATVVWFATASFWMELKVK